MLFVSILGFMAGIALPIIFTESLGWAPVWYFLLIVTVFSFIAMFGLMVINPNESKVITFFGKYVGTVVDNGFFMVNPFVVKKTISLKARNLNSDPIKVNDKMGNPIMIGVVLVWRVKDTFKACFAVDNYEKFVDIQSEAAIRSLAGSYPYDDLEDEHADITLRSGGEEVNDLLEVSLSERLNIAGIEIIEARISYLAYAPEIASAMLQRQQAGAIIAAREQIVEGAVSMVEQALTRLENEDVVVLDDERRAQMVSNLLVVLTSDHATTPVINTGSLYS